MADHDQTKSTIPNFYGTKDENISAKFVIRSLEAERLAHAWTEERIISALGRTLRGGALTWIDDTVPNMLTNDGTWNWLKNAFLTTYEKQYQPASLINDISALQQKNGQTPSDFGGQCFLLMNAMKANAPIYTHKPLPPDPTPARMNAFITEEIAYAVKLNNIYWTTKLFTSGLKKETQSKVIDSKCTNMDEAIAVAETEYKKLVETKRGELCEIGMEKVPLDKEEIAFIQQRRFQAQNVQNNQGQNQYQQNGYNQNKQKRIPCVYCKRGIHKQEVCYSRIRDNKPCRRPDGSTFWPNQNQNPNQNSQQQNQQNKPQKQGLHTVEPDSVFRQ